MAGANEAADFRATSLVTLMQMVAGGHGITLLPQMATSSSLAASSEVACIPMQGRRAGRVIGLIWRKTSAREADYRLLGRSIPRP